MAGHAIRNKHDMDFSKGKALNIEYHWTSISA